MRPGRLPVTPSPLALGPALSFWRLCEALYRIRYKFRGNVPDPVHRCESLPGRERQSRGSTGSDSNASTPAAASCTRQSGSPPTNRCNASSPSGYSRSASASASFRPNLAPAQPLEVRRLAAAALHLRPEIPPDGHREPSSSTGSWVVVIVNCLAPVCHRRVRASTEFDVRYHCMQMSSSERRKTDTALAESGRRRRWP